MAGRVYNIIRIEEALQDKSGAPVLLYQDSLPTFMINDYTIF